MRVYGARIELRAGQEIEKKKKKREKDKRNKLKWRDFIIQPRVPTVLKNCKGEEIAFSSREGSWVNISV